MNDNMNNTTYTSGPNFGSYYDDREITDRTLSRKTETLSGTTAILFIIFVLIVMMMLSAKLW